MFVLLQIFLIISFVGIVTIVAKTNLQNFELRKAVKGNFKTFLRNSSEFAERFKIYLKKITPSFSKKGEKKIPPIDSQEEREDFFQSYKQESKEFFRRSLASSKKESGLIIQRFFQMVKEFSWRFVQGSKLFASDMKRVSLFGGRHAMKASIFSIKMGKKFGGIVARRATLWGKNIFHKSKTAYHGLKEDLKTLEFPTHKEDFFDKLQTHVSRDKISKELLTKSLGKVKEPEKVTILQNTAPGFQEQEIELSTQKEESDIVDAHALEQKERNLLEAIAKQPKNPNFYKRLGKIYLQMQNIADAKNCFEYALKLGAQDPELSQLIGSIGKTV